MKASRICFIYSILLFLVFAWDIENDRDFWTWMWLLSSIVFSMIGLLEKLKNKPKK